MDKLSAIILCGGSSTRMGALTAEIPKSLLLVNSQPIMWYVIRFLIDQGVEQFIFPLGYKGSAIRNYLISEFAEYEEKFQFIDTGESTPIHHRIEAVAEHIKLENFVLLNSDTIYSFDLRKMVSMHKQRDLDLTLATVPITSPWGVVVEKDNKITKFQRDLKIDHLGIMGEQNEYGQVYSGLCIINTAALTNFRWDECVDFETDLFNSLIAKNTVDTQKISGFWYPIDTPKHLKNINEELSLNIKLKHSLKFTKS